MSRKKSAKKATKKKGNALDDTAENIPESALDDIPFDDPDDEIENWPGDLPSGAYGWAGGSGFQGTGWTPPKPSGCPELVAVTDKSFKKEIQEPEPLIVDFSANWCIPCKEMTPEIEKAADANPKIRMRKADIDDDAPEISKLIGITSVPTLVFYKEGREIFRARGSKTKEQIEELILVHFGATA